MTKVYKSEDCGNSPKNILVQDVTIAIAKGDLKFLNQTITDDIRWNVAGDSLVEGKENFARTLKRVDEIAIQHVTTHGKAGAVNGTMKLADGKEMGFCQVYEFVNTKGTIIKEITSYLIETK